METLELEFVDSITTIGNETWNAISGTENPFTRFEFLAALELSGCTTQDTGWAPHHVAVYDNKPTQKTLVAIMPLYLKTNSYGEYVFDWSWASAYQSHGFEYYPKFVSAIPFTPSAASRIFIKAGYSSTVITKLICEKVIEKAQALSASSWHILFPLKEQHEQFDLLNIQARIGSQYHWYNENYASFDEFLASLNSRKRKAIRKERTKVGEQGISFAITEGKDISESQWQRFMQFYESTYMMRGMRGYLNDSFFHLLSDTMPEQLFMIHAKEGEKEIAAALFFRNSTTLFGRYWGSGKDCQFLHFETCYYQGQDYCIEHGLRSFDSGAQGEHKIQRGFKPIITYSNHWISNQGFADAIGNFLNEEKPHILSYIEQAKLSLPFKQE